MSAPLPAVDLLILGAGWTSTFLIPLCVERRISYAATSRPAHPKPGTVPFHFDEHAAHPDRGPFAALPRARTVLVIDPPRKGTDERFIEQMVGFGAATVVYVSCNVHTQARDVGVILRKSRERAEENGGKQYVLESLRGLDLFPQTAHVEAIAVLRLI